MDNKRYYKVCIDFIIRDQTWDNSIFLKLKDSYILYRNSGEDNMDAIVSLKAKGLENIYLDRQSYLVYVTKNITESEDIVDEELLDKKNLLSEICEDEKSLSLILNEVGFPEKKIIAINGMRDKLYKFIGKTKGFEEIAILMSNNQPTAMMKKSFEIFIGTSMLNLTKFKDKKYLDSYISAILVFDSILSEDEYWQSYSKNTKSKKILNHSLDIISKIPVDFFPPFIIPLIKGHHEKPDGTGYPLKLTCREINFFTAVYIVSEEYVQEFLKRGMRLNEIEDLEEHIHKKYSAYIGTHFEEALRLIKVVIRGGNHD
jgi:hypothetical protein